eukprot:766393-Hanusia_phi.AAC.2
MADEMLSCERKFDGVFPAISSPTDFEERVQGALNARVSWKGAERGGCGRLLTLQTLGRQDHRQRNHQLRPARPLRPLPHSRTTR